MPTRRILPFLAFVFCCAQSPSAEWQSASVPGPQSFTGVAWYRAWLKPHPTYFSRHERDLFAESVILNIRNLADAHELFVNGKKIGAGGLFPPQFKSGRDGNHRHKIPPGLLVKDQWNEIAVRVYCETGNGGFLTEAPFTMNYFNECVFEGKWDFQRGDSPALARKAVKDKPATAIYDSFHESSRVLGRAEKLVHGAKLSPAESFSKMEAADDLVVDLMLNEPLVAQPVYFSFDERGRIWVAQYRQYPYPAGLKMVSRDRYYRSHYDKVPPAPPNHDKGADTISIHEDTDGDGKYDKHKVFLGDLNMANAAVRGHGGVWVMNTPYLLFYPDKNFDDIPDGPPEVRLAGFGLEDSHSVANGIVWGMDGWLYGAQGSTTTSHVRRPGIDPPDKDGVYFQSCMVWRYHPETRKYEIFAEGGGNNFGLEVDAQGRLFTGHNGGKTRGWHYVQNGLYMVQGTSPNKYGPPRNPFAFGTLPMMGTVQPIIRFTHFASLVESSAIPKKYQGTYFSVDPLHNLVVSSLRRPLGATFDTSDVGNVLTSGDSSFRPVFVGNAPDGSMLVADFYEHYIAHGQHYQSQIDPTTGRIFRLRGKGMALEKDLNLAVKSTFELIALLGHANRWHRHTAVRLLGERKEAKSKQPLRAKVESATGNEALCALWAHYQAFGLDEKLALTALRHSTPSVRTWAVRLMCDDGKLNPALFGALIEQARYETDAEARSQMAGSARRLPGPQALKLAATLLTHDEDLKDLYIPMMCWWVLEAKADSDRDLLMALFDVREFWDEPVVFEHILPRVTQRFALRGQNRDLLDSAKLFRKAPDKKHAKQLLSGFESGFRGRPMTGLPAELIRALADSGSSSLALRLRLNEPGAVDQAMALIQTSKAKLSERLEAVRTLGEMRAGKAMPMLLGLIGREKSPELLRAVLTALTFFDDSGIGAKVVKTVDALPESARPAAYDLLLARTDWTRTFVKGLADRSVDRTLLSIEIVERMRSHKDAEVSNGINRLYRQQSAGSQQVWTKKMGEIELALAGGTGNPYSGEQFFLQRCAACHKLFHKGGAIGPDLTSYQRDKLDTMLISILNPSAEIREGFQYYSVETKDDRSLSGFLKDQDNQVVVLRGLAGEDIRLQRSEVAEIKPMGRSLMPEGLLQGMDAQQLRDFFAYLRISQPISN